MLAAAEEGERGAVWGTVPAKPRESRKDALEQPVCAAAPPAAFSHVLQLSHFVFEPRCLPQCYGFAAWSDPTAKAMPAGLLCV